jgi:enamine deaminase RidA (YjgF/YER057c/UK114 family)
MEARSSNEQSRDRSKDIMSAELIARGDAPPPKGYADGRLCRGRALHIAGQIGWNTQGEFVAKDLIGQFTQALDNVLAVLAAAHGHVGDVAAMTIYVTDIEAYRSARKQLGPIWSARFGAHYPAMALVAVTALVEPEAVVEIAAVAYLEREDDRE